MESTVPGGFIGESINGIVVVGGGVVVCVGAGANVSGLVVGGFGGVAELVVCCLGNDVF
jgi:hypothetical protein